MNIKKIIREELEDDWGWAKELKPAIILEPNTMYFFDPVLKPSEIGPFANSIPNSDYMRGWLLDRISDILNNDAEGLKYFVTSSDLNGVAGWCTEYPLEDAKLMYRRSKIVDARKEFNL